MKVSFVIECGLDVCSETIEMEVVPAINDEVDINGIKSEPLELTEEEKKDFVNPFEVGGLCKVTDRRFLVSDNEVIVYLKKIF